MPAPKRSVLRLPLEHYAETEGDRARAEQEQLLGMAPMGLPLLNEPAHAVAITDIHTTQTKEVIERLYAAAEGQRTRRGKAKRRTLVGLAAPQIGEPLCIVLIDTKVGPDRKNYHKLECFINPEILWRSRETEEGREGCFSAGAAIGGCEDTCVYGGRSAG